LLKRTGQENRFLPALLDGVQFQRLESAFHSLRKLIARSNRIISRCPSLIRSRRDKGFEWVEDEAGNFSRSTITASLTCRTPNTWKAMMVEDMKAAGLDPTLIYAFEQTGLLVIEQNHT